MLKLYMRDYCPFSIEVMNFAKERGIELTLEDIAKPENEKVLMTMGGKHETPFLVDEERGESLYESTKIISYLSEHYAK